MNKRIIITAAILASALVTSGCKQEAEAPEVVRPVLSTVLEPTPLAGTAAVGIIEPQFKTELSFRTLGRLITRPINVGDLVAEGQIVGTIDATTLEFAARSARAEVYKAEARLANASATEERQRILIARDATTEAVLDSAEQGRAGAEAAVARGQANLTKAIEQLGYAQLKAEFAGVVTAVRAEVGQVVTPGQSVLTIARPDIREAVVDLGADFPVELRPGLPFTVSIPFLPDTLIQGKVREIAPLADPVTRTRRVRIALDNPPATFRLGATVTARLSDGQGSVLRVPASAVLSKDDQSFVWVVDFGTSTVSLQKVDVSKDEQGLRVTGGLVAGARVVTAGIHSLKQGQKVRIEQEQAP
jgi:RND family efflux transporter MFP subunit